MGLGIAYKVLDFKKEYKERVVEYFYDEYKAGRTPNPDAMCNREIKFGMFYRWAMGEGFDAIATGHYARIEKIKMKNEKRKKTTKNSKSQADFLMMGADEKKDQSYFLYQIRPEQLAHILFPLGGMRKTEVRKEAKKRGLSVADKPDSVGICFIGPSFAPASEGKGVKGFLKYLGLKEQKGEVVDTKGRVIGEHDGVWFYTIGQRSGFRVQQNLLDDSGKTVETIPPFYVIEKEVEKNRLVVGFGPTTLRERFEVGEVNWLVNGTRDSIASLQNDELVEVFVRIRHLGKLIKARIQLENSAREKLNVELEEAQRGVAPGQAAVFYDGRGVVLGGGVIV